MQIPVFVSTPSTLNAPQTAVYKFIQRELALLNLEDRTLGKSDYPTTFPLREVRTLAKHCSGGVILGFAQFEATAGISKKGTKAQKTIDKSGPVLFPTPWNHIEAGILFALNVPLMIFREESLSGGVFDMGVTDQFIHTMPDPDSRGAAQKELRGKLLKWATLVRAHYYGE